MKIDVRHDTVYRYEYPPRRIVQLLRLEPPSFDGQAVPDWSIDLNVDAKLVPGRDAHGNITHLMTVEAPVAELRIAASGTVETFDTSGIMMGLPDPLPPAVYLQPTALTQPNRDIAEFARDTAAAAPDALTTAHALLSAIYRRMKFETGTTSVETTAAEAFAAASGVCQDLAHLFCAAARALGMPARYVSGHLFRRDGQNDQVAAHAWAEAWTGDRLGWVSFDPAHGISTDDHYVRIACGGDYRAAAPVAGSRIGGGEEILTVTTRTRGMQHQRQSQSSSGGRQSQSQSQSSGAGTPVGQQQQQQQEEPWT